MNLTTTYMGLELRSPLVVGAAAPLTEDIDNIKRMEDAGAAAVVLHSLFEEQIEQEMFTMHHHLQQGTESYPESLTYFPEPEIFHVGSELYLEHIRKAKERVNIPIIASLNGSTLGGWTNYARQIEQAGADALELNIYYIPTEIHLTGEAIERQYLDILKAVKAAVTIPVAVKLSPYFTNLANMAHQLTREGADALVLFNRFYQPDIDVEELEVKPNVLLSTPQAMRLPMRWIAILYGRIAADLAATSGIQKGVDVVRMLMAGAKVTMIVSALLRHGINHLQEIEQELRQWMQEHDYASISELYGTMSQRYCPNPSEFERVQYMKAIQTYTPQQPVTS
ncbi:dihydroorotate oxidase [Oscillatoria nigro-viridis PCC 7112]|uniref:Dihydroorotate oxidase n=1 Tax=Phormidium nigroviride PCC 7112 TaxID=179408 RepID=K9VEQ0_9CYAN|nr:dihydroorotate dehydrogenase-like protein [Oscillatoria nigro-viridis]AFZ05972.1 dihydroorotate oxidase [Oscillatoria nigro-viridis PCC 7112]